MGTVMAGVALGTLMAGVAWGTVMAGVALGTVMAGVALGIVMSVNSSIYDSNHKAISLLLHRNTLRYLGILGSINLAP
jgi:hypothetical protein